MTGPLVSICIPAYKAGATIREAIQSALDQTYSNLEIIVIDNASPDDTVEVARSIKDPRITVSVNDENHGPVENWNRAIAASKGAYVKLLCADDIIDSTCVARQVQVLEDKANASVALVSVQRTIVDDQGKLVMKARGLAGMSGRVDSKTAIRKTIRSGSNPMGEPAALLVRGDIFRKSLPWSGDFPYMIDVEMWIRILELGELFAIPESLATFRVATGSWSREVVSRQRHQATGLFHAVRARRPDLVSRLDVRIGIAKAWALMQGRRATYWWLDRRS